MTFYVGQKVVCVDDSELDAYSPPVAGRIYTVRAIAPDCANGELGLNFVELPDRDGPSFGKHDNFSSYDPSRFRPAVEPNIQQFRDLVAPIFDKTLRGKEPAIVDETGGG